MLVFSTRGSFDETPLQTQICDYFYTTVKEPEPDSVFIARQPILDVKQNVVAYELLFRSANTQKMEILDDLTATSQVLLNTINSIGVNRVLGNKQGFVNMNERVFQEGIHESLDKGRFVLEILEHTKMTPELVKKLAWISEEGYTLALDDFVFNDEMIETFRPVFPYISIIKVDLFLNDLESLGKKLKFFRDYKVRFLAEKVENQKEFNACKKLGFELFQGFFFAKPEIMAGKKVDPNVMAVMELVRLARSTDDTHVLEAAFKRYPDITVNFLRFINSASLAFRTNITSVRHALNLIGQQKLVRWLMLLFYAKPGISNNASPLLMTASMRARLMENLLIAIGHDKEEELEGAFLAGVLSLMDVIFQVQMDQLLKDLRISDEISACILKGEGLHGQLLQLVIASERQDFSRVSEILEEINMSQLVLSQAISKSYVEESDSF